MLSLVSSVGLLLRIEWNIQEIPQQLVIKNMSPVYKYLPPDRKTYLDDELLRFTQPGALNDPFECIPIVPKVDPEKFVQGLIEA